MSIFSTLASNYNKAISADAAILGSYAIEREAEHVGGMEFVTFANPTDLLVSRWYPGYRVTDLTGSQAEEAIAILLGDTMRTVDDLESFRRILATPGIASNIIGALLPRSGVPVKGRNYMMTEDTIAETVKRELGQRGIDQAEQITAAFTHAITRVLAAKGLVAPGAERRIVKVADSFAITAEDMRRVIMIEAMRGIFSETRINATVKYLDQDTTPLIFAEKIGDMFRQFSFSLPEIKLRLEQFEIAVSMIKLMNLDPNSVPNSLQAHPALIALASIANFMVYSAEQIVSEITFPAMSVQEVKDACNAVLTVIQSAPSIESMPLSRFGEYFGEAPAASPDGIRRGLVMYSMLGQTSKMEVADVVPKEEGAHLALVDPAYVKASGIAGPLNGSLLSTTAMSGLANIVADELAMEQIEMRPDCTFDPRLLTIQVSKSDIVFLALARSTSVAYVRTALPASPNKPLHLLYGCTVAEQWRMAVLASTPSMAFFLDPAAVLVYTSKMVTTEPKPFPTRSQTIGLQIARDIHYVGDITSYLDRGVEENFTLKIPVAPYGGETTLLKLSINVLGSLVGYSGNPIDRGTAYYAAVREPGVDKEVSLMLQLALAYAELPASDIQGDKARSWLIVNLAPVMMHPSVRLIAERAVNTAVLTEKLDARRLAPQMKELYSRAFFGTTLAILNRFGKIDGDSVTLLTRAIPTQTLSLQAALTLAALPAAINGASSMRG